MNEREKLNFINLDLSLTDLLGKEYTNSVCTSQAFLRGKDSSEYQEQADEKLSFYPNDYQKRLDDMVDHIGEEVCPPVKLDEEGIGSAGFNAVSKTDLSPLACMGFIRIGENGKAYICSKSEHYHTSLGHRFPGYRILEKARAIGISNATHNNTRGYITRHLETELIREANGLEKDDKEGLEKVLESRDPHVLNRVINLETGSLVVEAAIKMMLGRFYVSNPRMDYSPPYKDRIPVFLVFADAGGSLEANYHGTTVIAQTMRGMWPDFSAKAEESGLYLIRSVDINNIDSFKEAVRKWDSAPYKIAGFLHELILMNYAAVRIDTSYIHEAYKICHENDIPVLADEIQTCLWSPKMFTFREYDLDPDFVSVGKGFPGGEYSSSRILFSKHMDNMDQFGALVTNGQDELSSLSYLISMAFTRANSGIMQKLGDRYHEGLKDLASRYPEIIDTVEGSAHLSALFFRKAEEAVSFTKMMKAKGIDISAQTYKANCPPATLTKLPLISSAKAVDFLLAKFEEGLKALQ